MAISNTVYKYIIGDNASHIVSVKVVSNRTGLSQYFDNIISLYNYSSNNLLSIRDPETLSNVPRVRLLKIYDSSFGSFVDIIVKCKEEKGNNKMISDNNKEEQLKEIQELKDKVNKLEKLIKENKEERIYDDSFKLWKPERFEGYYGVHTNGKVNHYVSEWGDALFEIGNYFKTKEEAEQHIKNLKTKQKLKELAYRLNKGVRIDWDNHKQCKYSILACNMLDMYGNYYVRQAGIVYCLSKDFLKVAEEEIGTDKLNEYIKTSS
jgi:hypothetical protein